MEETVAVEDVYCVWFGMTVGKFCDKGALTSICSLLMFLKPFARVVKLLIQTHGRYFVHIKLTLRPPLNVFTEKCEGLLIFFFLISEAIMLV